MANVLARIAALCFFLCLPSGVQAQQIGKGLVCDSVELAEKFVAFAENVSLDEAIVEVNAEAKNETACLLMELAFVAPAEVKVLKSRHGTIRVIEVLAVALRTNQGFQRIPPFPQFILKLEPSSGA